MPDLVARNDIISVQSDLSRLTGRVDVLESTLDTLGLVHSDAVFTTPPPPFPEDYNTQIILGRTEDGGSQVILDRTGIFINNDVVLDSTGLYMALGEIRLGNGVAPGSGFSGLRLSYPAMSYNSDDWHFAGVLSDVLQAGINASDGKFYAGAGDVVLDVSGITIAAGGLSSGNVNTVKWTNPALSGPTGASILGSRYASLGLDYGLLELYAGAFPYTAGSAVDVGRITLQALAYDPGPPTVMNYATITMTTYDSGDAGIIVLNSEGTDVDVEIASENVFPMIYVDASEDKVGIGKSNPATTLDINGVTTSDAFTTRGTQIGINLIKNYPSNEKADGAAPDWWLTSNVTLTEEDATGESITPAPNERVLKAVSTSASHHVRQDFAIGDESLLQASTDISIGVWVYVVTSGTITFYLWDAGNSNTICSDTTVTTGGWVWLEATGTIASSGTTTLSFRIQHSVTSATFYFANPVFNIGTAPINWRRRLGQYIYCDEAAVVNSANPADANYHTADFTSVTSANTFAVNVKGYYSNTTAVARYLYLRPYYSTANQIFIQNMNATGPVGGRDIALFACDYLQRMSYKVSVGSGETDNVYLLALGYWEWEGT